MQEIGRWFSFALKLVVTAPQLVYCLFHLMAIASTELALCFETDCQSIPRVPGNHGLALSCCNLRLRLLHVCEQQGCRGFNDKFPQRIPYRFWTKKPTLRVDILTVVLRDWERKCETSLHDVYSLWLRDAHLYGYCYLMYIIVQDAVSNIIASHSYLFYLFVLTKTMYQSCFQTRQNNGRGRGFLAFFSVQRYTNFILNGLVSPA